MIEAQEVKYMFTAVLTPEQIERMRGVVQEGWEMKEVPYAHFSAKRPDLSVTLYQSGKLVVQGKGASEFVEMILEPQVLQQHISAGSHDMTCRIGVDEAGKGDYFGPLVIAGVCAGGAKIQELLRIGVRDSKTLSDAQVHRIAKQIRAAVRYSLVVITPAKYNELHPKFGNNLNRLLAWGHAQAIKALAEEDGVLLARIDQFAAPWVVESALKKQGVQLLLEQQTKGESDPVIAAASILARAGFLEGLTRCSESVGMELPKGAGAPVIQAARALVAAKGKEVLLSVAKMHFKTTVDVIGGGPSPQDRDL